MLPDPEVLYKGVKARVTRGILLDWKGLESKTVECCFSNSENTAEGTGKSSVNEMLALQAQEPMFNLQTL